jgi:hypothetical protein
MTPARIDAAHEIGSAAGAIWTFLHERGPTPVSKIVDELDQSKDVLLQGIGWLAREGKIEFAPGKGKARLLRLVD